MLTVQQREIILKLNEQEKTQQQIAAIIGCSQVTVSKWISAYKAGRTLETLPRSGRPTRLKPAVLGKLRSRLRQEVKRENEKFCSLNTKQLSDIITKEIGVKYSLRHVERIMHSLGFSLVKPRSKHIKHDAKKVEDFRADFKKNFKRNMWIMPL